MSFSEKMYVLAIIFFVSVSIVALTNLSDMRIMAIERGYAIYCPSDGEWNWVGECDSD